MKYLKLKFASIVFVTAVAIFFINVIVAANNTASTSPHKEIQLAINWKHISSTDSPLPRPSASTQQTASLILDVDNNGTNDFVIGIREAPGPSLVWYRYVGFERWARYIIEDQPLPIEAGGAFHDIDGDGDQDVVMAGDRFSNEIWWWENPYPNFIAGTTWTRRLIKNSGEAKHHDQIFGDFDGDGQSEFVFWNQGASTLYLAEIPADPRNTEPWPYTAIYSWDSGGEHEGLAAADMDGDGQLDIIGGGRWFKHNGGTDFTPEIIDDGQRFSRAAVGQLKEGGRPEVVFVSGDGTGPLQWYEWDGDEWEDTDLLNSDVDHGHSLQIVDINEDGYLDIFNAEMRLGGENEDAGMWLFLGNGNGDFTETTVASGFGNHESRIGDLDGDGDLDILGKPYNWETPRIDLWLNQTPPHNQPLDRWQRHVIDDGRPWRAIFMTAADLNSDDLPDIIAGGWWYQNPGQPANEWTRHTIGAPLNNMAAVYDFDSDGDIDILGTGGQGSEANDTFVWARNDGEGNFTILDNVENGDGDFLQGVTIGQFQDGANPAVVLSWHVAGKGVQQLTIPDAPATNTWEWRQLSATSQDEGLSSGDIDGDGDLDLLLGTQWLRNDLDTVAETWTPFTANDTGGNPDRNRLADVNQDGRPDAVVGFEAISQPGKLAWYEQPPTSTLTWTEHIIDDAVIGPMSLDVADMNNDGDLDVIVGEHNLAEPATAGLFIFENADGQGGSWTPIEIYRGDEHHDGAQVVDIDNDGDLDIISTGWGHDRILLYENKAVLPPVQEFPHQNYFPFSPIMGK